MSSPRSAKPRPVANSVLAALPPGTYRDLLSGLEPVALVFGDVLYEPGAPIREVYFPTDGLVSLLTLVEGRLALEVGLVGREGMVGVALALGIGVSPRQHPHPRSWRARNGVLLLLRDRQAHARRKTQGAQRGLRRPGLNHARTARFRAAHRAGVVRRHPRAWRTDRHRPADGLERQGLCIGRRGAPRRGRRDPRGGARAAAGACRRSFL